MTAIGSAKKSPDEIMALARRKFERNKWDTDQYRRFLRAHGFNTPNLQGRIAIEKPENNDGDDVSINKFEPHHFNFDFTLGNNDTHAWPFVTFYVDPGWLRNGEYPDDGVSFGWDSDEYDYDNEWWGSAQADLRQYSGRGVAFGYNDAYGTMKNEGENWIQARIRSEGGTESTRNVIFSYLHTWESVEIQNISVGTSGVVTMTLSDETKKWNNPVQDQLTEEDQ
jgi:hypothetical protein